MLAEDDRLGSTVVDALRSSGRSGALCSFGADAPPGSLSPLLQAVLVCHSGSDIAVGRAVSLLRQQFPLVPTGLVISEGVDLPRLRDMQWAGIDVRFRVGPVGFRHDIAAHVDRMFKYALPASMLSTHGLGHGKGWALSLWCARNAFRRIGVSSVAEWTSLSRKTACRYARKCGWKSMRDAVRASRLLHVAVAVDVHGLGCEQAAVRLAFGSGASLRKFVQRSAGRSWSEFVDNGAVDCARGIWQQRHTTRFRDNGLTGIEHDQ